MTHAICSASSSDMWLHCPPSARKNAERPDSGSNYAEEGSQAHALCEHKLRRMLGQPSNDPSKTLTYFTAEMEQSADDYVTFVLEQIEVARETCPDPYVAVEQRVDFSDYVQEAFGTADCIVVGEPIIRVIDLKYGAGVAVSAEENSQLKLYALGALAAYGTLFDIDKVVLSIVQPRRDNISTFEVSTDDLYRWAGEVLKPAADLAFKGEGEYSSGSWCKFCRVKAECRTRAEYAMELAKLDFKRPPMLEDDEVEYVLEHIDELISWANDIKDYALGAAIGGKRWYGWKLVEGRSNRCYTSETTVAAAVAETGYDPYEHTIISVTAMEKLLGKRKFAEILGSMVMKPRGKPVLVPETDKRPEINTAAIDFAEPIENGGNHNGKQSE